MNEPEKIDPRELSPLALAFVGDSVLELLVRQRLVEHHRLSAGKLNAEKVKYVSARAQFRGLLAVQWECYWDFHHLFVQPAV